MRNLPKSIALMARELGAVTDSPNRRLLFVDCAGDTGALSKHPIVTGLQRENWGLTVLAVPLEAAGNGSVPAGRLDRLTSRLRFFRTLARLIPRHQAVLLQAGTRASLVEVALPAIVLARFFGKRVLLRFNTADIEVLLDRRERLVVPILKQADELIVGSRYLQRSLARSRLRARVLVGPVDLTGIRHRVVEKLQPRILMTEPLNVENNPLCALRVFRLVKQKYPRAELVIAGDGPLHASMEREIKASRLFGVEFVTPVSPDDAVRLHAECDLYLNSSTVDEAPAGLVRALAAGLPVVVTDADGLLPMVRERVNALIAPVNDHCRLADRIIELIEHPELAVSLSRAGATEAQKYNWSRVRQDWVNTLTGSNNR